ncbi:MAG: extracellular solute-binding protein [Planctomycetota bacterium]|nr:extracellular solute-binding protein [Planctomycetota bacterium]
MRKARVFSVGVLLILLSVVGCDRGEPPLVVYVSADEYVARPILASFSEHSGIPVHLVGDTEATKTTGLVDRIRGEQNMPVADVFWSSEAFMTIQLAREGLLQAHHSPVADAWFTDWRDPDNHWFGFSPRPRVLVYDPARLAEADVPTSLQSLSETRWQDELVMADPRFGTTGGHLSALQVWYRMQGDQQGFQQLLDALADNRIRVLPGGNAAVVDEVRSGRVLLGMTDADDVRAANRLGAGLAMRPVGPEEGIGTFLMPNTVAMVAGSDHPRAGELVDFLLSEEVARQLAESPSGNIPLVPEVAMDYPDLIVPPAMPVDFNQAATEYPEAVRTAVMVLRGGGSDAAP